MTDSKRTDEAVFRAESAGLDTAWAAAVASLPDGWSFSLSPYWDEGRWWGWEVEAHHYSYEFDNNRALSTGNLGAFETPAAAISAAAEYARLTEADRLTAGLDDYTAAEYDAIDKARDAEADR